jgi:CheY-like chemotaxis protein
VVDDESDVEVLFRQQFRRDLRAGRFSMEFAQSAPVALQRITDAGDRSLILILSDINMPGMSGLELLPKAKAMRPDVPIIMITAYGDAETKRKALEKGAEALLTKPIDADETDALADRHRKHRIGAAASDAEHGRFFKQIARNGYSLRAFSTLRNEIDVRVERGA